MAKNEDQEISQEEIEAAKAQSPGVLESLNNTDFFQAIPNPTDVGEALGDKIYDATHDEDGSRKASGNVVLDGVANSGDAAAYVAGVIDAHDAEEKAKREDRCEQESSEIDEDEAENTSRLRFQEQCFLLENYDKLSSINFLTSYDNYTCIHGDPSTLVTNLNSSKNLDLFTKMEPATLSQLQPTFRLFKVNYDENGKEEGTIEYEFDDHYKESNQEEKTVKTQIGDGPTLLNPPRIARGGGVGLVNFDWKYVGVNPAEASNIIEASMKLRFETLYELTRSRVSVDEHGNNVEYKFIDLLLPELKIKPTPVDLAEKDSQRFLRQARDFTTKSKQYNPDYFTFKVVVGWADPGNALDMQTEEAKEFKKVLNRVRRTLVLVLTTHELEFTQEGPVYITINFQARWDVATSSGESDLFNLYNSRIQELESVRNQFANGLKAIDCVQDTVENYREKQKRTIEQAIANQKKRISGEKTRVYSQFYRELFDNDNLYNAEVPMEQIGLFMDRSILSGVVDWFDDVELKNNDCIAEMRSTNKDYDIEVTRFNRTPLRAAGTTKEITEELKEEVSEDQIKAIDEEEGIYNIPFLFLGDAIEIGVKALMGPNNTLTDNMKFLLGDVTLEDPRNNVKASINLADIPISMRLFQEWFIDVVWSDQRSTYPAREFLTDIAEKLIVEALAPEACFNNVSNRDIKISFTSFNLPNKDGKPIIDPDQCGRVWLESFKEFDFDNKAKLDTTTYFLMFAASEKPDHLEANYEEDIKRGITHFGLGEDEGILKTMNFSRNDFKYVREARIVDDTTDSQLARLREYYTVTLKMVGNEIFVPGQMIYVNPSTIAFGNPTDKHSYGQALGIVGYFQVVEVEHYIEAGTFETTVTANWVASGIKSPDANLDVSDKVLRECGLSKKEKPVSKSAKNKKDYDETVLVAPSQQTIYLTCPEAIKADLRAAGEAAREVAKEGRRFWKHITGNAEGQQ